MALFSFHLIAEFLFTYNSESFFIYRDLFLKKFNIFFMVSPHDNLQTLNTRIDLYENLRQSLSSICLFLRFPQGHLHLKCRISGDISEIRHFAVNFLGDSFMDNHLLFLHDICVPPTNNKAERLLRAYKRKQKHAMSFRSVESIAVLCSGMIALCLLRRNNESTLFKCAPELSELFS